MKFEKLNDSKIKILFTQNDMNLINISTDDFFSDNSISQEILQSIIEQAEQEIDFKTDDSKLLVEAIKNCNEDLIFTITKIDDFCNDNNNSKLIIKFESFDDFLNLCTYIQNMSYIPQKNSSEQFTLYLYNNSYYLSISDFSKVSSSLLTILNEFGEPISFSLRLEGLINEYGKIIFIDNAINQGIQMIKR